MTATVGLAALLGFRSTAVAAAFLALVVLAVVAIAGTAVYGYLTSPRRLPEQQRGGESPTPLHLRVIDPEPQSMTPNYLEKGSNYGSNSQKEHPAA